jgi:hypothetical protein
MAGKRGAAFAAARMAFFVTSIWRLTRRPRFRPPSRRCPACRPVGRTDPGDLMKIGAKAWSPPRNQPGSALCGYCPAPVSPAGGAQITWNQSARAVAMRETLPDSHPPRRQGLLKRITPIPPTAVTGPGDSRCDQCLRLWAAARGGNPRHRRETRDCGAAGLARR